MAHRDYMKIAIELAEKALSMGEVPVGAVVVKDGEIIGEGYNTRESRQMATGHAEISAIEAACKALGSWRLEGCTLYVTLEPCAMCAGAIINSRIDRVVYGAPDMKSGAMGGRIDLTQVVLSRRVEIIQGVREEECLALLDSFFKSLR